MVVSPNQVAARLAESIRIFTGHELLSIVTQNSLLACKEVISRGVGGRVVDVSLRCKRASARSSMLDTWHLELTSGVEVLQRRETVSHLDDRLVL